MESITVSVHDIGVFVLFCLALVVGIYLIIILSNFNKIIKRLNGFMDSNRDNIKETITLLPSAVKNLDAAAVEIKENVEKIGNVVDAVEETVTETAVVVGNKAEGILETVNTATSVIKIIIDAFSSRNKD